VVILSTPAGRAHRCFVGNAQPNADLRYFSNCAARLRSETQRRLTSAFIPRRGTAARQSSLSPTLRAKTGGKGIRTPDFQLAKLALYQLSYAPRKSPSRTGTMVDGRWKIAIWGAQATSLQVSAACRNHLLNSLSLCEAVAGKLPATTASSLRSPIQRQKRKCRIALHSRSGI
jgi:hypothetical protein